MKIYSKTNPIFLLHIIVRASEVVSERENIVPDKEFLQLAVMELPKGKTFRPHKHTWKDNQHCSMAKAQESWVVIKGSVKAILYDTDDSILATPTLYPGDCSITLHGGHNYEILEDDTIVYEFKTGPYEGVEKDKIFI